MNEPRVLLATLAVRKSQRTGKSYLTGWLGKSRLIGFPGRAGNGQSNVRCSCKPSRNAPSPAR